MPVALLLINPKARRGSSARSQVKSALENLGFKLLEPAESESQEACDYPRIIESFRREIDLVIAGGGDGSLKCAIEGAHHAKVPIGILPAGTANNVARTLGIPLSLQKACEVIAEGHSMRIDLGKVNGSVFVSVAGIGLSTEIHASVSNTIKRGIGPLAYALHGLKKLRAAAGFKVEITSNGKRLRTRAVQVTVCNGKHYGGRLIVSEEASLNDQKLDLLLIEARHKIRGIWSVLRSKGRGILQLSGGDLTIETWPPMKIDADGATVTQTPAHFEIIPDAVQVFIPKALPKSAKAA